jgi:XTP/dITP diphosphohydrolase
MRKIVFVTGNKGKFNEARSILEAKNIELVQNTGGYPELQEDDLEPIASFGAKWAAEKLQIPVMVDDSGLFINALHVFQVLILLLWRIKWVTKKFSSSWKTKKTAELSLNQSLVTANLEKKTIVFTGTVEGATLLKNVVLEGLGTIPYLSITAGLSQRSVMKKRTSFLSQAQSTGQVL